MNAPVAPLPEAACSYHQIIGYYLTKTYTPEEYKTACEIDPDWGIPRMYAVSLEAVLSLVRDRNPSATRAQILALDQEASGHADYQRRLAIACAHLAASYKTRHAFAGARRLGLKI